ncbi:MAG: T9SS type A sorting domain-containing protein [Cryomorphaceae bacterium]|nr:T9SS type A sorting domain-containing protein [Cryomorphaceae bacterium]
MRYFLLNILALLAYQVCGQITAVESVPLLYPRSYNGAVALGSDIFTAGGLVDGTITATAEINFGIDYNSPWTEAASMLEGRTDFAMMGLDANYAIVAGGWDGTMNLASTELYDKVIDEWTVGPQLSEGRSYLTATKLLDGKIAFIGGYNGTNDLATVDIYDPVTHSMSTGAPMIYARSSHVAVRLESGFILVAGGFNPDYNFQMTQCELYNPFLDEWTEVAPLNYGRDNFDGVLIYDGRALVTGGRYYDGASNMFLGHSVAEMYDPEMNDWTTIETGTAQQYHRAFSYGSVVYGSNGGVTQSGMDVDPIYSDGVYFFLGSFQPLTSLERAHYSLVPMIDEFGASIGLSLACFIGGDATGTGKVELLHQELTVSESDKIQYSTFPNPVIDRMTIVSNEPVQWDVYSLNGQLVLSGSGKWVDCQALPAGTYNLIIRGDSATETKTFQRL